ncbi:MAG: hypothetical protein ACM3VZ_06155 [Acidobacteriota bacterium]
MSHSRRELETQLAELAAGKRESVSVALKDRVSGEERYERDREEQRHRDLLRHQEATAAKNESHMRRANEAVERGNALREYKLQELERHHEEIERIKEQQLDDARLAQEKKLALAREENERQDRHRSRIEELEEQRHEREEEALENERLRSSPCYASAKELAKLREIELEQQEYAVLTDFFARANVIAAEFNKEVQQSDAKTIEFEQSEVNRRQKAIDQCRREVGGLIFKLQSAKAESDQFKKSLGLLRYLGVGKAKLMLLEQEVHRLDEQLRSAQAKEIQIAALARFPLSRMRRKRIKALATSSPAIENYRKLLDELFKWIHSEPHTRRFSCLIRVNKRHHVEVEYSVCVALDQAKATGAVNVAYPQLGELPFGDALLKTSLRVKEMVNPFVRFPDGKNALDWLEIACSVGEFDLTRAPSSAAELASVPNLGVDFVEEDGPQEAIEKALIAIRSNDKATVSLLQKELRLPKSRAAALMERLEDDELVSRACQEFCVRGIA